MRKKSAKNSANGLARFQELVRYHLRYTDGKAWDKKTRRDIYRAVAMTIRERLIDGMLEKEERYNKKNVKRLYYLSMEFLMGRAVGNILKRRSHRQVFF